MHVLEILTGGGILCASCSYLQKCVSPRDVREQDPAQGPAIDPAKHLNNESMQTNTNVSFRFCSRRMYVECKIPNGMSFPPYVMEVCTYENMHGHV